jgi:hypothetical protein
MAKDAYSRAQEEERQKDSFIPTLGGQGSELITLTEAAMCG